MPVGRLLEAAREAGFDGVGVDLATAREMQSRGTSLAALRTRWPALPFVGMEPAVKPAAALTTTGVVGVLATAITARGEALARLDSRPVPVGSAILTP